jgi:hypothetical protein
MNLPADAIFHPYPNADDTGYAGWFADAAGVMLGFKRLDGSFEAMLPPIGDCGCCTEPQPQVTFDCCGCGGSPMIGQSYTVWIGDKSFPAIVTGFEPDGRMHVSIQMSTEEFEALSKSGGVPAIHQFGDPQPGAESFDPVDLYAPDPLEHDPADDWKRG